MLGHSSAAMTMDVYGHFFEDRLDEVANALDAARQAAEREAAAVALVQNPVAKALPSADVTDLTAYRTKGKRPGQRDDSRSAPGDRGPLRSLLNRGLARRNGASLFAPLASRRPR